MVDLRSYSRIVDINCTHLRVPRVRWCIAPASVICLSDYSCIMNGGVQACRTTPVVVEHQLVK